MQNLKHLVGILLLLGFSVLNLFAQCNSVLWEISGNGLSQPSYLYGTIHSADERVFAFGDSTKKVWKSCQAVVGEIYISKDSAESSLKYILLPAGTTLKDYMSPKEYAKVKKFASKHLGSESAVVDYLKPVYTAVLLAQYTHKAQSAHPQRSTTLDEYLQVFGAEQGKEVFALESYQEQFSALDLIPMDEQVNGLLRVTKKSTDAGAEMENMISLYLAQDLDVLLAFMQANPEYSDVFSDEIIIKRNERMALRIETQIRERTSFIAVGCGHLPGEKGIISLMRQNGFTLRPVYSSFK